MLAFACLRACVLDVGRHVRCRGLREGRADWHVASSSSFRKRTRQVSQSEHFVALAHADSRRGRARDVLFRRPRLGSACDLRRGAPVLRRRQRKRAFHRLRLVRGGGDAPAGCWRPSVCGVRTHRGRAWRQGVVRALDATWHSLSSVRRSTRRSQRRLRSCGAVEQGCLACSGSSGGLQWLHCRARAP